METQGQEKTSAMARHAVSEVIALQRAIFKRQTEIIEANEAHQTEGFSLYRDTYQNAVSHFIDQAGFGALCDQVAGAQVTFVADYHTLRLAQKTLVTLIQAVMQQVDGIGIATELVDIQYQEALDAYLKGKIKEQTFLRRIKYKEHWPYDIWPNFKPIFELAKEQGFPMRAIDSDSALPLNRRDAMAAEAIAQMAFDFPDTVIFVSAGQMHMAPSHLPHQVDLAFQKRLSLPPKRVIIYQNAEEIYWQLAKEGREQVEVVKINPGEYCVNNTPPLVQQLSYLNWIQYDEELIEYTQLETTVRSLIKDLADYLELPIQNAADRIKVLMPGDLDLVDVLENAGLDQGDIDQIVLQAEAEESICVPEIDLIYLATLSINHAAEESGHFLKYSVSKGKTPGSTKDLFYFTVLNEACAFFGSKVINPKRKADHPGRLRAISAKGRQAGANDVDGLAATFALSHLRWERSAKTKPIQNAEVLACPFVFNAAAHFLGYILGDRLYYGLTDGLVAKSAIRELFLDPLDKKDQSFATYLELCAKLGQVKIPRRI